MASCNPALTEEQARAIIKATPKDVVVDAAMRFANCREADVDDDGDVWVNDPCTGHWLTGDKLTLFAEGLEGGV